MSQSQSNATWGTTRQRAAVPSFYRATGARSLRCRRDMAAVRRWHASLPASPPAKPEVPKPIDSPGRPEKPYHPELPPDDQPPEVDVPPPDVLPTPVREPPVTPAPLARWLPGSAAVAPLLCGPASSRRASRAAAAPAHRGAAS